MAPSWFTALLVAAAASSSSEPPRIGVREAVAQGRTAFIGRVTRIEAMERARKQTEAVLEVEVLRCLYGSGCLPGHRLSVRYLAQTVDERARPAEFWVAGEDLFVLAANPDSELVYFFDSDAGEGADLAFRGRQLPRPKGTGDASAYTSVYGGVAENVAVADLEIWAAARARELATGSNSPPRDDAPAQVGGVDPGQAPQVLERVEPEYPREAKKKRIEGLVVLEVVIDESGRIQSARLMRGNPVFETSALDAVMKWRFSPGSRNGEAVPVTMTLSLNYTLEPKR